MKTIDPHILRILSHWGEEPSPTIAPEDQDALKGYASMAHEQGRATWVKLARASTQEELERLIRGMVRAEEASVWWGGSVSLVVQLFAVYAERWPDHRLPMADWIMANSTNHYIPFDRGGSRNHVEYEAYLHNIEARRIAQVRVEEEARIRKEQQRIERAEQHEQRLHDQQRSLAERDELMRRLQAMPLDARLKHIVADQQHPVAYYPVSIMGDPDSAGDTLSTELLEDLRQRLASEKSREWDRWIRLARKPIILRNREPVMNTEAYKVLDREMVGLLLAWGQLPTSLITYKEWMRIKSFEPHVKEVGTEPWINWAVVHGQQEVEALIRGLVRVDANGFWPYLAYNTTVYVFAVHNRRWSFSAGRMADWVKAHSKNEHLPYGYRASEQDLMGAPGEEMRFLKHVSALHFSREMIKAYNSRIGVPEVLENDQPREWPPIHPVERKEELIRWAMLPLEERIEQVVKDASIPLDHYPPELFVFQSRPRRDQMPASFAALRERILREGGPGWMDLLQEFGG